MRPVPTPRHMCTQIFIFDTNGASMATHSQLQELQVTRHYLDNTNDVTTFFKCNSKNMKQQLDSKSCFT